ncbi:SIMPL domain-containing protein [Candidatus Kaistella beijingensis]|uniref:SIMPL domain-containing protein n=1 Tax=Candidatus Kaistella beijingensis TaxID=2820270 RepID=UPI001CC6A127|nr:SIMPL domain-containing protein [Candidatus Kaistella beijingensis]UBB89265.1 SIMPL domain-containing protein [Candidatus Kaistella beijingensis]
MNKNIIAIAIAALGFIIGLAFLGNSIKNRNKSENTISVTGLGTKKFTSDLINWSGTFSRNSFELKSAYDQLANDKKIIENYLTSKGIPKNEIVFSAVDIQKQFNYGSDANGRSIQTFSGYQLSQTISIDSKDVAKIENLSRNITEIINLGIEFTSSPPSYFYSKLADVKHQMIADATKDAKQRAEKIAENAGSSLGKLKKATMGITQITAPNSTEEYSYGGTFNTSSKDKEASITIKLEYQVD